jgi:hypothetical protein
MERLKAEYCRSVLATWHCVGTIEPIPLHAIPELRDLAQANLFLRLNKNSHSEIDVKTFRAAYAHHRVMDQLAFFKRQCEKAQAQGRLLRSLSWLFTIAAVFFSCLLLYMHIHYGLGIEKLSLIKRSFMVLLDVSPLACPALASYMRTCMAIEDVDRRIGQYRDLQAKMRLALVDLSFCGSWESLVRTVERTEKILLNELLEWYSVSRYAQSS